jgi:tetratricopeptide (TPR) repeat protein
MNAIGKSSLLTACLALALSAIPAAAQKCEIKDNSPFQLASAKQYLGLVRGSGKPDERPKHLRNAVRVLTDNAERIENQLGRQFLLGQVFHQWLKQPGLAEGATTRGNVGYTQRAGEPLDLFAAMDSAFSVVETQRPECADSLARFRRDVWIPIINAAVQAANSGSADSAKMLATRSLVVFRGTPHAYNVLANVAQKTNDMPALVENLGKVIEIAGSDTAWKKQKLEATYNLGVAYTTQAETGPEAERKEKFAQAAKLFREYLAVEPDNTNAQAGLARALQAMGDTAAVVSIFSTMIASPDRYTDIQLFEAGVAAARAKREAEAAQLFEHGLKKNPYYRDALFNLANMYLSLKDGEKMLPVSLRLAEVDPGSPNTWTLVAASYQLLAQKEKAAAKKKALNDSLVKYIEMSEKIPYGVTVNDFRHAGAEHTVLGQVENRGKAAKSFNLRFEFLDASGNVVAKQEATVGPVEPARTAEFTVKVQQSGITAYRYSVGE